MKGDMSWFLYAICAQDVDTMAYFKFGISQSVYKRICSMHTGSPIPFVSVSLLTAFTYKNARSFERFMHRSLAPFISHGEWFRFDLCDPEQKNAFQASCREIECKEIGVLGKWRHFDIEGFMERERQINAEIANLKAEWRQKKPHTTWGTDMYRRHVELIPLDN